MPAPRGKFIWYDVMTSDTKAATAFYSDVIGWQAQEHAMPDNGSYTVFSKGERMVAGLMALPGELCAEGVRACWSGYIASDDVDADAARVVTQGGAIRRAPQDVPNVGRFAIGGPSPREAQRHDKNVSQQAGEQSGPASQEERRLDREHPRHHERVVGIPPCSRALVHLRPHCHHPSRARARY